METWLPSVFMSVLTRMSGAGHQSGNGSFTMIDIDKNEDDWCAAMHVKINVNLRNTIQKENDFIPIQFCLRSK